MQFYLLINPHFEEMFYQLFVIPQNSNNIMKDFISRITKLQLFQILQEYIQTCSPNQKKSQLLQTIRIAIELRIENQQCKQQLEKVKQQFRMHHLLIFLTKLRKKRQERRKKKIWDGVWRRLLRESSNSEVDKLLKEDISPLDDPVPKEQFVLS